MINRQPPNHHVLLHEEKRMVLFLTPKAGNTTIKRSILRSMRYDLGYEPEAGFVFIEPEDLDQFDIESYTKVAVVRNPYDRLKSAWQDKIMGTGPGTKGLPIDWGHPFTAKMEWTDYIDRVCERSYDELNLHVRHQYQEISDYVDINTVHVFKFEDLIRDYTPFQALFKDTFDMKLPDMTHENGSRKRAEAIYTREQKLKVYNHYIDDFNIFQYDGGVV